nr:Mitochondrial ribosomal protein L45 [Danio rerio]
MSGCGRQCFGFPSGQKDACSFLRQQTLNRRPRASRRKKPELPVWWSDKSTWRDPSTSHAQLAIRKIKDYDSTFTSKEFPGIGQQIFIDAHAALTEFNKEKLHSLVTERCYPEMVRGNRYKTLRWRFIESLEPPRLVQARCPDMISKGNLYGQVTVRMHSRQTLAIYDRFGRLMLGDEEEPRDVLEYLVMERHLVNPYGRWRLHGKIVPAWAPPKDPIIKTVMIPGPKLKSGEQFEDLNYQIPKPNAVQWHK